MVRTPNFDGCGRAVLHQPGFDPAHVVHRSVVLGYPGTALGAWRICVALSRRRSRPVVRAARKDEGQAQNVRQHRRGIEQGLRRAATAHTLSHDQPGRNRDAQTGLVESFRERAEPHRPIVLPMAGPHEYRPAGWPHTAASPVSGGNGLAGVEDALAPDLQVWRLGLESVAARPHHPADVDIMIW